MTTDCDPGWRVEIDPYTVSGYQPSGIPYTATRFQVTLLDDRGRIAAIDDGLRIEAARRLARRRIRQARRGRFDGITQNAKEAS